VTDSSLTGALRETLALFEETGDPVTTTEVADRLEVGRRSAYDRLDRLAERDRLATKKVGANARVWWRPTRSAARIGDDSPTDGEPAANGVLGGVDVGAAVVVFDEDGTVAWVNAAVERYFGLDRTGVVGRGEREFVADDVAPTLDDTDGFVDRVLAADGFERGGRVECRVTPTGERAERWLERRSEPVTAGTYAGGRAAVYRDVTERKRRERELSENRAQYETIVETVEDGIYAVDEDARFVVVNDGFCELTGYDRAELLGAHATLVHADEITPEAESKVEAMVDDGRASARIELDVETNGNGQIPCETRLAPFPVEDGYGRCGVVRDVSDRLEREAELQRRIHQQAVVTNLGRRALEDRDIDALLAEAAELVAETLGTDLCEVLDFDESDDELLLRCGVGWDDGLVGSARVSANEADSQAAHTLRADEPVVVTDLAAERRFDGPALLTDHDVRSGVSTVVGPRDDPWGILGTHDRSPTEFSTHDVNFVQSVANILASAIARHDRDRELERRRERLAALNSLNEVVRETTDAVVGQSTRGEIEETVCTHLAESDSYSFAWVGDVDAATKTVNLRTEAGVEGYLDGVTISVDPDDERSEGPTGRAIRTGEVQTTQNVAADARHDPWRDHVEQYGFRSSAAIPVVHEDASYGVLNVYSDRAGAFEDEERSVMRQLGEVVGHAIAAAERKRALMSDDVVELAFEVPNLFTALNVGDATTGRVTFDHAIPVESGSFLLFGTTTGDGADIVRSVVERRPHWEEVTFQDGGGGGFEAHLSDPPVLSAVASVGGSVERAVIEDGGFSMTIHAPPTGDVRRIIDRVREVYPTARLLKQRQITRLKHPPTRVQRVMTAELTERQHQALEAAFHSGFFEWPRESTGEEVAASLNVAPPTFHQHLRKAERKVFDHLLSASIPAQQ
jgi:PAS domain S-box-containing protein